MSVAAPMITLRPVTAEDEAFLQAVYASTREHELALVPWSRDQKDVFLGQQFAAQAEHYETYEDASFDVVELDGVPVGRLYVARWPDQIRVMDVALLPEHRAAGIGTALLRDLLAEGAESGKPVSIHVERQNPARRLYERLGFRPVEERGLYVLLEATPNV
jgi:ribosomal protein S18 acetylase RimI-like enzyme